MCGIELGGYYDHLDGRLFKLALDFKTRNNVGSKKKLAKTTKTTRGESITKGASKKITIF